MGPIPIQSLTIVSKIYRIQMSYLSCEGRVMPRDVSELSSFIKSSSLIDFTLWHAGRCRKFYYGDVGTGVCSNFLVDHDRSWHGQTDIQGRGASICSAVLCFFNLAYTDYELQLLQFRALYFKHIRFSMKVVPDVPWEYLNAGFMVHSLWLLLTTSSPCLVIHSLLTTSLIFQDTRLCIQFSQHMMLSTARFTRVLGLVRMKVIWLVFGTEFLI